MTVKGALSGAYLLIFEPGRVSPSVRRFTFETLVLLQNRPYEISQVLIPDEARNERRSKEKRERGIGAHLSVNRGGRRRGYRKSATARYVRKPCCGEAVTEREIKKPNLKFCFIRGSNLISFIVYSDALLTRPTWQLVTQMEFPTKFLFIRYSCWFLLRL